MLKISGNDILREGAKVGWIDGNDIRSRDGRKLGYFTENDVFDAAGRKLAFIDDNYLNPAGGSFSKIPLDCITKTVKGGALSLLARCAAYLLIGA